MQQSDKASIIASGFAMFSMFFGAGNVIYPLMIGIYARDQNIFAISGLLITAVVVPFIGLIASILFDGNYKEFFSRIGKWPGFILCCFIMALIGPFGATPRTVVIAWSTVNQFLPDALSLTLFSALSTVVIFLFTFKRSSILDILGYFLTPILLLSLGVIIIIGLFSGAPAPHASHETLPIFIEGLKEGYNTMDLLATFFFANVVLVGLKSDVGLAEDKYSKKLIRMALKASCIGAILLGAVYVCFSFVSASYSEVLRDVSPQYLIAAVSLHLLGPVAGIIACAAVALACLTTAIALCSVFAEFIHTDITKGRVGYLPALLITLMINFAFATMDFTLIMQILVPILQISYPAIILLSILNILYKLYDFKPIKAPVLFLFLVSFIGYVAFR